MVSGSFDVARDADDEEKVNVIGLEAELPVCELCGNIGKQPMTAGTGYFCTGPEGRAHRRVKMVRYIFEAKEAAVAA